MHDLHAVIEFVAELTQRGYDGDYDQDYEPLVRAGIMAVDTQIEKAVAPVQGFKGG